MAPPQHLKPERLELDPTEANANKKFTHWLKTFQTYVGLMEATDNKLDVLINFIGHEAYSIIESSATYANAITALKAQYQKPVNSIYARHLLSTRKQIPEESLDHFARRLKLMSKDCKFTAVTAEEHAAERIRDSFITNLQNPYIRLRLLENDELTLDEAFTKARALDIAHTSNDSYTNPTPSCAATNLSPKDFRPPPEPDPVESVAATARFNRSQPYRSRPPQSNFNRPQQSECYSVVYPITQGTNVLPETRCVQNVAKRDTMPEPAGVILHLTR